MAPKLGSHDDDSVTPHGSVHGENVPPQGGQGTAPLGLPVLPFDDIAHLMGQAAADNVLWNMLARAQQEPRPSMPEGTMPRPMMQSIQPTMPGQTMSPVPAAPTQSRPMMHVESMPTMPRPGQTMSPETAAPTQTRPMMHMESMPTMPRPGQTMPTQTRPMMPPPEHDVPLRQACMVPGCITHLTTPRPVTPGLVAQPVMCPWGTMPPQQMPGPITPPVMRPSGVIPPQPTVPRPMTNQARPPTVVERAPTMKEETMPSQSGRHHAMEEEMEEVVLEPEPEDLACDDSEWTAHGQTWSWQSGNGWESYSSQSSSWRHAADVVSPGPGDSPPLTVFSNAARFKRDPHAYAGPKKRPRPSPPSCSPPRHLLLGVNQPPPAHVPRVVPAIRRPNLGEVHVEEEEAMSTHMVESTGNQTVEWRSTWSIRSLRDRPGYNAGSDTVVIEDDENETNDAEGDN